MGHIADVHGNAMVKAKWSAGGSDDACKDEHQPHRATDPSTCTIAPPYLFETVCGAQGKQKVHRTIIAKKDRLRPVGWPGAWTVRTGPFRVPSYALRFYSWSALTLRRTCGGPLNIVVYSIGVEVHIYRNSYTTSRCCPYTLRQDLFHTAGSPLSTVTW